MFFFKNNTFISYFLKFFTARKLDNVLSQEELFNLVTGQNFTGTGIEFLSQVRFI